MWSGEQRLFCGDLETSPPSPPPRVLVTGATGYVGGKLVPELLARGYPVRVMIRKPYAPYPHEWLGVDVAYADCLNPDELRRALLGVDVAYYLIHSMATSSEDFEVLDFTAASNFRAIAAECGLRRIVYLGGLGELDDHASLHLRSRIRVGQILSEGSVPVTVLRAAVIVGSGSASFELIRSIAAHHRLIPVTRAFRSVCQPIGIRDVVKYLVGVVECEATVGCDYDIGGPDRLTYREMVQLCARAMGRRVRLIQVPAIAPGLVAWNLSLIAPVPLALIRPLLDSIHNDVVCREDSIRRHLGFSRIGYVEAVRRALRREAEKRVPTRWTDRALSDPRQATVLADISCGLLVRDTHARTIDLPVAGLFRRILSIGAAEGWLHANWAWRLRGLLDRTLRMAATPRGRRDRVSLRRGDVVDFWRVESVEPDRRLLLRAELRAPGRAWLEFELNPVAPDRTHLAMRAYFVPHGFWGRVYWCALLPFHTYIFRGLLRQLVPPEREVLEVRAG